LAERVWVLAVVSSSPQELTLDAQEQWAKETAASNGWEITRTFKGVSSGKFGTRQLLKDLLAELRTTPKAQRPRRVLTVRLDRLGRGSGLESIAALAEIRSLGTTLWTREDGDVRLDRASDSILPAFRAIQAALENEVRSDRVKAGKARRKAQGLHNGNPPYGCTLLEGRAVAYEPEAILTREIFERRARGWGYDRLARFAAERAIPKLLRDGKTRRLRWGRSTIQRLLWCETLRGIVIEPELFAEANAVANADFKLRGKRAWAYPLSGAVRCTCGQMLSGQASGRERFRERYYVCRQVANHGYYPHHRADITEAGFVRLLDRLAADPGLLDPAERKTDLDLLRAKERTLRFEIESIEERRRQIWGRADALTGPQLRERLDEIDVDRDRVRNEADRIRNDLAAAALTSSSSRTLAEAIDRLRVDWPDAPLEAKQEAARAVAEIVGGLYLAPAPRTEPGQRKRGQPERSPLVAGIDIAGSRHLIENMRLGTALRVLSLGLPVNIRKACS
jgi:DNA invertase Pin-like site-specific DNA recombinase